MSTAVLDSEADTLARRPATLEHIVHTQHSIIRFLQEGKYDLPNDLSELSKRIQEAREWLNCIPDLLKARYDQYEFTDLRENTFGYPNVFMIGSIILRGIPTQSREDILRVGLFVVKTIYAEEKNISASHKKVTSFNEA